MIGFAGPVSDPAVAAVSQRRVIPRGDGPGATTVGANEAGAMSRLMPQIETVVILMLENRSLDNVLGWLHHDRVPARVVPADSEPRYDGIQRWMTSVKGETTSDGLQIGRIYSPRPGTQAFPQPSRTPRADPWEGMAHVQRQMYGNGYGVVADRSWGDDAPMAGFVEDYLGTGDAAGEVLGAYSREQLPVLYGLAENFAVSDAWFSSVPTETDPNRAFSVCGTSLGRTGDIPDAPFDAPTMFNGLDDAGVSWGIYWQYRGWLDLDLNVDDRVCWTVDRFPHIRRSLDEGFGDVQPYQTFLDRVRRREELPDVCYIEPFWGWGLGAPDGDDFVGLQGNDYHPPTWVGPAERDLNELYEALLDNPLWEHLLLVISFDEHGGTWDHVAPPRAVPPDADTGAYGDDLSFRFDRFGPRVPTILVSPHVTPGTVFRAPAASYPFDHASVISTLLGWAGTDPAFVAQLGMRVAHAPTFETALSDRPHLDNRPRFRPPAPDGAPPLGPHGWPFELERLPWDAVRTIAGELAAAGQLDVDRLLDVVRHRFGR